MWLVLLSLLLGLIRAECPDNWKEYKNKCYGAFETGQESSWTAAESVCQTYGGDLAPLLDTHEKDFVYQQVINRRSYDYYWIGLNDLTMPGRYEWVTTDGITNQPAVSWTFWSDGLDPVGGAEPSTNPDKRCTYALFSDHLPGEYGRDGKWVKGKCNQKFKYVCRMDPANFVRQCDEGWMLIADKYCIQSSINSAGSENQRITWQESLSWCGVDGGVNLELENADIESEMRAFIKDEFSTSDDFDGVWLGITDLESDANQLTSYITQMEPNYQNWNYGQPTDDFMGARCVVWSGAKSDQLDPGWTSGRCGDRHHRVCMKRAGNQCPPGWTFHATGSAGSRGKCYQYMVNGAAFNTWYAGRNYCAAIGANIIAPSTNEEMNALAFYFDQWKRAGVTRFWIGYSNTFAHNSGTCDMRRPDGGIATYPDDVWSNGMPEAGCDAASDIENGESVGMGKEDVCAYIDTNGSGEWKFSWKAGTCVEHDAFGCEIEAGGHIHSIPNENRVQFHCEKSSSHASHVWYVYTDEIYDQIYSMPNCYTQPGASSDAYGVWDYCEDYCTGASLQETDFIIILKLYSIEENAIPASVHSSGHMNFIESMIQEDLWLGMNNIVDGKVPSTWPFDKTPVNYLRFDTYVILTKRV